MNYLIATVKKWNIDAFEKHIVSLPGQWKLVTSKEQLTDSLLKEFNPRYIFFPHWSWMVPARIYNHYDCVCFHMTDVPYGRGGSPLQNLIVRGHKNTKLTALKMEKGIDTGPVYKKIDLSLKGSASQIFSRASDEIYGLIRTIVNENPIPDAQEGLPVVFKRRTPEQSRIPLEEKSLEKTYDYIRMLDAESYPSAFLDYGNFTLSFNNSALYEDKIVANVIIRKRKDE